MNSIKSVISAIFSILMSVALVNAATITVQNTNDGGAGSLRQAISDAVSGDTIDFNLAGCPCTIALTSEELSIVRKSLFITGPGANQLTISGNNARRVVLIDGQTPALVTISGVTIANGSAPGGGGVFVQSGKLTILNSIVRQNSSSDGGGGVLVAPASELNVISSTISENTIIGNSDGGGIAATSINGLASNITLVNSTISNNTGGNSGGGVLVSPLCTLTSSNTDFTNNTARFSGGGIENQGSIKIENGSVTLNDVTGFGGEGGGIWNIGSLDISKAVISSNTTTANGGGIYSQGSLTIAESTISGNQANIGGGINNTNNLAVSRSTISGNTSASAGGGISNSGTVNITNSTISGNQATGGTGGGINNANNGTTNLRSSTVAFNSTSFRGGGVANDINMTAFNVQNTIIAQNTAANRGPNGEGAFVSQGTNLIGLIVNASEMTGFTNGVNGDIVGTNVAPVNPQLVPLADNGGPTQTHALQSTSPAIDKGNAGFGIVTDQRGNVRFNDAAAAINIPGGSNSDIGAFEFVAPSAASVGVSGRVLTSEKRGLNQARVIFIDSNGNVRSATTSTFGYFGFPEIEVGETYVVIVRSKSYRFAPQIVTVEDEIADLNLVAIP